MSTTERSDDRPLLPPVVKYVALDEYSRFKLALYEEGTEGGEWIRSDTTVDDVIPDVR